MKGYLVLFVCLFVTIHFAGSSYASPCSLQPDSGRCLAYFVKWHFNYTSKNCETFIWGGCEGNDNRFDSEAECKKECYDVCALPKKRGPCKAKLLRWRYDPKTGQCVKFFYGGCRGNANNFETREDCEAMCPNCEIKPDNGLCRGSFRKWYSHRGTCMVFYYGGCQGNSNRFKTEADCQNHCEQRPVPPVCNLPSDPGLCYGNFPHWYFDGQKCSSFTYGGCGGNGNRFVTEKACQDTCK
ncbi:unnamed protein product [Clavelina lepadiformis]|uniref:BPTI/Kunitz inhibitor domain-containing protein n=1 Tax=Clavelina lepadiformis TaxID=159417 RepID=A0ABP0GT51_CLALP